ncbi:unnamed protein product [Ceutorhynchus assimilis]|uniref:Uncharacterized protein n=1 Tax=Ceutorhynchus assimilis TaxID=467358 RepID=A0A9N9MAJ7_9CUCU|nr:unnamed protein product [Ceutorhynchus assimilis]
MAELEAKLKRKRAVLKGKVTVAYNFINKLVDQTPDNQTLHEVEIRLERLVGLLDNFQEVQSQIEEIVPLGNLDAETGEWGAFENSYYKTVAYYKTILDDNQPSNLLDNNSSARTESDRLELSQNSVI